jgi:hypothetical protein
MNKKIVYVENCNKLKIYKEKSQHFGEIIKIL